MTTFSNNEMDFFDFVLIIKTNEYDSQSSIIHKEKGTRLTYCRWFNFCSTYKCLPVNNSSNEMNQEWQAATIPSNNSDV